MRGRAAGTLRRERRRRQAGFDGSERGWSWLTPWLTHGTREQRRLGIRGEGAVEARAAWQDKARLDDLERVAVGGAGFVDELGAKRQAQAGLDAPAARPLAAGSRRVAPASRAIVAMSPSSAATLPPSRLVVPMKPLTNSVCGRS